MVSNIVGEIHGAIPTNSHWGTAMTGSNASIDTIRTWMIELVGSVDGMHYAEKAGRCDIS
jgi:hypothetical protein